MIYWVIGSLNVDLVVDVERFPDPGETVRGRAFNTFLGGKGGNQAMALARLGGQPRVVARVGQDQFGERYLRALTDAGAVTDHIAVDKEAPTGTALIEVDSTGQNRIVIVAGANGTMMPDRVIPALDAITAGDIVLLQLEIPFETVWRVAADATQRGAIVILDPAPAAEIPVTEARNLGWITPNEHEARILTGIDTATEEGLQDACAALIEAGVRNVVIKAGTRGAYVASQDDTRPIHVPGFTVTAVDTTAAGDAFNGGLARALGEGYDGVEAVRRANAVAALSVTAKGAQGAMPDSAELERFLSDKTGQ